MIVYSSFHLLSCLSIGTNKGYAITNCEPFGRIHGKSLVDFYSFTLC